MSTIKNEACLMDIGLSAEALEMIAALLTQVLADTFAVSLKTQNYHWNVKGPSFLQLHKLFDEQYNELHDSVDMIAERIRAMGHPAPGSLSALASITSVKDPLIEPLAEDMVRDLLDSNQALVRTLRKAEKELCDLGDAGSSGLMEDRIAASEKHAWMLRMIVS